MTEEKKKRGRPKKVKTDEVVVQQNNASDQMSDQMAQLQKQVDMLSGALALAREGARAPSEDQGSICVIRSAGPAMIAHLTDAYGRKKSFAWNAIGEKLYLTPAQYSELMESPGGHKFFTKGWLVREGDEQEFNAISDIGEYLNSLKHDEIDGIISASEDTSFLIRILNYIESLRVVTTDEKGNPLTDDDDKVRAEIRTIDQRLRLAAESSITRIYELTGVRYSLSDG